MTAVFILQNKYMSSRLSGQQQTVPDKTAATASYSSPVAWEGREGGG